MKLSASGLDFIKRYEGFVDHVYDDGRGVRTIGYGTTEADVDPLPHHVTEPQAARLLARRLEQKYEPVIRALFRHGLPFNQHRYDALVSFIYNLGPGAVPRRGDERWEITPDFETLGHAIVATAAHPRSSRHLRAIADALLLYSNPRDPAVHAGLLRRREDERELFLKPMGRLEGFHADERRWLNEFDRLKSHTSPAARRRRGELQAFMRERASAIAGGARREGWETNRYRARHDALMRRAPEK